jgi:hypothetical protein
MMKGGTEMLINAFVVLGVVGIPYLIWQWLFNKGVARAWHLLYVILPLSGIVAFLVFAQGIPLLTTWSTRLLFSVVATVFAMAPVYVMMKLRKMNSGQLGESWRDRKR